MKHGRVGEAKAVMLRLHGGGGRAGQRNDEIDREVDSMGGSKGEEQKGNVAWAEVGPRPPTTVSPLALNMPCAVCNTLNFAYCNKYSVRCIFYRFCA